MNTALRGSSSGGNGVRLRIRLNQYGRSMTPMSTLLLVLLAAINAAPMLSTWSLTT